MAQLISLPVFSNEAGHLTVFEKLLPGDIKRVFYIQGAPATIQRAGHAHVRTWNALICLVGQCRVFVTDGTEETSYTLDNQSGCLILKPADWHTMDKFSPDAVLLVLSTETYDPADYSYERPALMESIPC